MIIFKGYFSQAQNPLLHEINSKKKKKITHRYFSITSVSNSLENSSYAELLVLRKSSVKLQLRILIVTPNILASVGHNNKPDSDKAEGESIQSTLMCTDDGERKGVEG